MKSTKDRIIYIAAITLSILYILVGHKIATINNISYVSDSSQTEYLKIKVTEIIDDHYEDTLDDGIEHEQAVVFAGKITKGLQRGQEVTCLQIIDSFYATDQRVVSVGDTVIATANQYTEYPGVDYMFSMYYRLTPVLFLWVIFAALMIFIGRRKGVNTLISLAFSVGAIFYVFIPAVLNCGNIYLWSVSVCVFLIVSTLIIVNGISDKCTSAMRGCVGGVMVSGALTYAVAEITKMTGLVNDESTYLLFLNQENPIDLKAIIFASIIFGSAGAVMDVAMSLSASLAELKAQSPDITGRQLFRSGMTIGKDMMGTMANTLILAFIGSSLSITLLLAAYNTSPMMLLNTEMIISELLQSVSGSMGILLTIPFTSYICSILYSD